MRVCCRVVCKSGTALRRFDALRLRMFFLSVWLQLLRAVVHLFLFLISYIGINRNTSLTDKIFWSMEYVLYFSAFLS